MKQYLILLLFIHCFTLLMAQPEPENYAYVERDTGWLHLDLYRPERYIKERPTIIYFHGGGFFEGSYNMPDAVNYCRTMQAQGYTIISVDYRLMLEHVGKVSLKTLENAILYAAADGVAAIRYIYDHADCFGVNREQIYLLGNSAGAVMALQINYAWSNGMELTASLPDSLSFAGIISYSGAILSFKGTPKYKKRAPAPTLFFHGTDDKLVPYNKVQLFCVGFYGTNILVKRYEKKKYPYFVRRYEGLGHSAEEQYPYTIPMVNYFVYNYGILKQDLCIDEKYWNKKLRATNMEKLNLMELFLDYEFKWHSEKEFLEKIAPDME